MSAARPARSNSVSASAVAFTVTGLDESSGDTGALVLTDGTFSTTLSVTGDGTYTANLSSWADGTVSAALSVTDPAGNSFSASTSVVIDPDFGATAHVSGPAGTLELGLRLGGRLHRHRPR